MFKILIYIESDNIESSLDLIEVAKLIGKNKEYETFGLCINNEKEFLSGLDYLINIQDTKININSIKNISEIISEVNNEYNFDCILILASNYGRMLAPRLAMKLSTGLVADVTQIEADEEKVIMIRPAFDGKIMAGITCDKSKPIMMSIRPFVFKNYDLENKNTKKIHFIIKNNYSSGIKLISKIEKIKDVDITKSDILVSGGGGVINNFQKLELLAAKVGGQVSASRRIVDSGIAKRNIQVGQSGKTVSPKIYIALGIYGSLQHMEGLKNVETIISVNINVDAPICSVSNIVIEGDAIEFIEKLIKKIDGCRVKDGYEYSLV